MLESMTAAQFTEWMAFASLEPFGSDRASLDAATICATIANVHRNPKRTAPYEPASFMPRFGGAAAPRSGPLSVDDQAREVFEPLAARKNT